MSRQVLEITTAPPIEVTLFARLVRANATLRRELEARLAIAHRLTVTDYECLLALAREPGGHLRRVDLAERVLLTPSGVTRLLDGLEQAGLVEKAACPSDQRVTYALITERGRATLSDAADMFEQVLHELLADRASPGELEALVDLLGLLPGADGADGSQCRA